MRTGNVAQNNVSNVVPFKQLSLKPKIISETHLFFNSHSAKHTPKDNSHINSDTSLESPYINNSDTSLKSSHNVKSVSQETAKTLLANMPYITTPTYDGSSQAIHPSIIDFRTEWQLDKWNGYRYWMAMTPFPNGNDSFENPSILVSNNGIDWLVLPSFKYPLDRKPGSYYSKPSNYNSDTELIYDPDNNSLILYWREYLKGFYEKIWSINISSSLKVEPKRLLIDERGHDGDGISVSPTVWRKSANEWYMWTANGSSLINLYSSKDGKNWSKRQRSTSPWMTWNGGYIPWHLEARPNYREQRVEFLINGWSKQASQEGMVLFYAEVPMDDVTNFSMPLSSVILAKGPNNDWDNKLIYRTTFTIEVGQAAYNYRVWYTGLSKSGAWHIGYTEGQLGTKFSGNKEVIEDIPNEIYDPQIVSIPSQKKSISSSKNLIRNFRQIRK